MRKIICFAIFALACVALGQDAKVTYSTVAVPVKKAVTDLAAKSGMNIACSASMDKEFVILRLKDAPMSEVMKQLAAVTSGTWTTEGETQYLTRDVAGRTLEENRLRKTFADKIAASLKKTQDALAKKPATGAKKGEDEDESFGMSFGFLGGGTSMAKLALAIGATQLASVPEDSRVVFSTSPTRVQRQLPSSVNAIITEFVAEHNKSAAAAKHDEPAKVDSDENMAAFRDFFGMYMKKPEVITGTPAKALVIATRQALFSGYTLELRLYDANGKMLASGVTPVITEMPFDPEEFMSDKPKPAADKKGKDIELSALSKEMYSAGGSLGSMGGAANTKLSAELMNALRDPVARDPLSFVHSEALIAIAEQRDEQLVANVPDGLMSFFNNIGQDSTLTDVSFLKQITGDDKAKVTEANGWLVVSPANPVQARKQRADRTALRVLIDTAQSKGSVGLDDVAAYATKNDSPMEGAPATMTYILLFAPSAMQQGMMGMMDWDLLRLYGLLSPAQRDTLRQGRRIGFSNLGADQSAQLEKMLYGPSQRLMFEEQRADNSKSKDPFSDLIMGQMMRAGGQRGGDFRTEPTEVMPNGLPATGYIQVNFSSDPVAQPQTMSTDFGRGMSLGPMELGLFKFFSEDPQMSKISGAMPTMTSRMMRPRSSRTISWRARV